MTVVDSSVPTPLAARLRINRRTIQIVLGLVWIVDGALKFQPKMFGTSFVDMVIRPMAAGQPSVVASSITHMANFLGNEVATWVVVFGLVELLIGVGLLFRRTTKPALLASIIWGVGIYWFGEGFGDVLTGHASPLTGAPGAVCFYVVLAVLIWPKSETATDEPGAGFASSAAGRSRLGSSGALAVWAAIWVFEAVLWMFPANRVANRVTTQMADTASGEPDWYAHFLRSFGHAFTGAGIWMAVIFAALSLLIGLGPLVSRRGSVFIGLGIGLALLYWITGQGVGELLTGMGTDPSNGPLIALIGLALLPTVPEPVDAPVPAARLFALHPMAATAAIVALAVVPTAVAVIPTATPAASASATSANTGSTNTGSTNTGSSGSSSSTGMSGMSMSGGNGSSSGSGSSSSKGSGKTANSMNMSGMAGLGVTDPNWKYTGPPLPDAEVRLLTAIGTATDKGHAMQTPDCTTAATAAQTLGAVQYVQATTTAVAKYKTLGVATAAGYVPVTDPAFPIVHYVNPAYMKRADIMDPNHVDSLVYAFTPNGPVLVAAMYLMPDQGTGPMPYGCLVQWHAHTNLCTSTTTHQIVGFMPCAPGTVHYGRTGYMTHVWQVPVAGGPLAIDPSTVQVMEAAIMAQQEGLAPVTSSTGTASYAAGSSAKATGARSAVNGPSGN
jgi:uncharacterized membrane protein YgcG